MAISTFLTIIFGIQRTVQKRSLANEILFLDRKTTINPTLLHSHTLPYMQLRIRKIILLDHKK